MERSRYRTYITVDLTAVRHNYQTVRSRLKPGCKVMSVIKADGYGHGAVQVAKALQDSDHFAVACLDEGIELRRAGISTPILILGYTAPEEIGLVAAEGLTQCVFDRDYALRLQEALPRGERLKVHLKIDTGMSRLGFYVRDEKTAKAVADDILDLRPRTPSLDYEGIFTHFTSSEQSGLSCTEEQFSLFSLLLKELENRKITFALRHCANSAAIFLHPETHLDMVRPGIVLYGYFPDPDRDVGLRPALEWKAYVSQIHTLAPGDTVSYNRTFRADAPLKTATVCVGYADGLRRALTGASLLLKGHRVPIVGRICMDQCVLDVTECSAMPGDTVTLIGADGEDTVTADSFARRTGTISYEILCNLGKRIPRFYKTN